MQRPAARDVERLHAAADAEQRKIALGGAAQQRELVLVGDAVHVRAELRVAGLAVGGGIEVRAAAEDEAVEAVEQRRGVVDVAVGGQDDGDAAGLLHRLRVGEPQREPRAARRSRSLRPGVAAQAGLGLGAQLVRDDPDQRRGGARRADGAEGRHPLSGRVAEARPSAGHRPRHGPSRSARTTASSRRVRRSRRSRRCGRGWWTAWVQCLGAAGPRPCGRPASVPWITRVPRWGPQRARVGVAPAAGWEIRRVRGSGGPVRRPAPAGRRAIHAATRSLGQPFARDEMRDRHVEARPGLVDQSALEPVRLARGKRRDHDRRGGEVRQRVIDRHQRVRVSHLAAGVDAARAQVGERDLEARVCARDGVVDVREPVAQARVERGDDDEHVDRRVARASRHLVEQQGARARPVGDDEDPCGVRSAVGHDVLPSWLVRVAACGVLAPPARALLPARRPVEPPVRTSVTTPTHPPEPGHDAPGADPFLRAPEEEKWSSPPVNASLVAPRMAPTCALAVLNEHEVRAAAGLTMVIGAVAFSYAYFHRSFVPLRIVTALLLRRVPRPPDGRPPVQPDRRRRPRADARAAARVGLRQAQAVRVDAGPGDVGVDGRADQRRRPRHGAADDLPHLPLADVDGVRARAVPGLQDLRAARATRLHRRGRRGRGLRPGRVRAGHRTAEA